MVKTASSQSSQSSAKKASKKTAEAEAILSLSLTIPEKWKKLFDLIPGYDPIATAVGCRFDDGHGKMVPGDCWFDEEAAQLAVDFFPECLTHVKGDLAGKPFQLEPWEQAIIGCLYGWKRPNGTRRYRGGLLYVPRKNGKTTFAAGMGARSLVCDGEPGAEIYCAAADRDQASLVFVQAKAMFKAEPWLDEQVTLYTKAIQHHQTGGVFRVISADAKTKHGFNTHLAIMDELHAQPNADLYDALDTSMGSRSQPLMWNITTSDFDRPSICNELHKYGCNVRDGILRDESFLPVIFELTGKDADRWDEPEMWWKANPNLGISLSMDYLSRQCEKAKQSPRFENTFKRLHLNIKTEQDSRFLNMALWDKCDGEVNEAALQGALCYGGLDLASTTDIAAFLLYFPETHAVISRFWIPSDMAHQRERRDRVTYSAWARDGLVTMTKGNVIDYSFIKAEITSLGTKYGIKDIGGDRWNLEMLRQEMADVGAEIIPFGMGFASLSAPTKELERLVLCGELAHGGNEVLRWMAANTMVASDAAENIKPKKPTKSSANRIDGIVALVMAIGRATEDNPDGSRSCYEDDGLLIL